ncbi:MAG: tetratricopeptide repeat protein [Candidatus Methanoplasma sp.]|jgi:tetratricopeptide (TPR) repeat protein|nr:tetratricopeptide repeat protein [Candidatus Methanoplasma sp.]
MKDPAYEAMSKAKRQAESGNAKGAVDTLEEYLSTDPHNIKARLQLARTAVYDLKDKEYGLMQINIILDLEPDNTDALKAAVTVLMKDKKNNAVTNGHYEKLLELCPDAQLYNAYAVFLRMQKLDFKKSAEFYEKAIAAAPGNPDYHRNYAVLLLNDIKDYKKAKVELETVLKLEPDNQTVKKNLDLLMKKKFDTNGNLKRKRFPSLRQ